MSRAECGRHAHHRYRKNRETFYGTSLPAARVQLEAHQRYTRVWWYWFDPRL